MSCFLRNISTCWHDEVPGARWFKADLHIHTLDDHPNANFVRPSGLSGNAANEEVQNSYARAFLKAAIGKGIEVLGLTPHAVKAGPEDRTSATWKIVEVWNQDNDDDGIPFRDKIYAIFPGFEPSLGDGAEGLHLIFLFDPEIGRENYIAAFNTIMGGLSPYNGNSLRMTQVRAKGAFEAVESHHRRERQAWNYICLAPHAFGEKGLFSLKAQVLELFPHQHIRGLQLKNDWLPEDAYADKKWLKKAMEECHQAFFHSSDAYNVNDIGRRYSLLKLASPSIESLRQAMLAWNSRLRIAYQKNLEEGGVNVSDESPSPLALDRPWLKSITLKGGTSLFAGQETVSGEAREQTFCLNPDLNCIIGGRMTGKSTLLDGLRVWSNHDLPKEEYVRKDVESRAKLMFLSGSPEISTQIHGPINPTLPIAERWPAQFFTQRELQTAVHDQKTRRNILYHLMPEEAPSVIERTAQLEEIDLHFGSQVKVVENCRKSLAEAEDSFQQVKNSKEALDRFQQAGIDEVISAQADVSKIDLLVECLKEISEELPSISMPEEFLVLGKYSNSDISTILAGTSGQAGLSRLAKRFQATLRYQRRLLNKIEKIIEHANIKGEECVEEARTKVQKAVIESGGNAEDINRFDALLESAADYEKNQAQLQAAQAKFEIEHKKTINFFERRNALVKEQRDAMRKVMDFISAKYPDQIRVVRRENGEYGSLDNWIHNLREGGVTRWWNNQKDVGEHGIDPHTILRCIKENNLRKINMSDQVSETFINLMSSKRKLELASIRCEDKYMIELKSGDKFKEIDNLSGGAQVSVLLSLILATDDSAPLVIDQPEDEIDKGYLFEVLLPALHRLKGRRQIIFATHDANIVVNGDADHVLHLESDSTYSRIENQGAIETPCVKDAIVKILDGGQDAFELRQVKYGF